MVTRTKTTWMLVALATLAWGLSARSAHASVEDRVKAHEQAVAEHKRGAPAVLLRDIAEAVALYQELAVDGEHAGDAERLVKLVGSLTKMRDHTVRRGAIEALGEMGHTDGARYLKAFLKPVGTDVDATLALAAIDAAGKVRDGGLVQPLLRMADKSKNLGVASRAVRALGAYGSLERHRGTIVVELAKTVRRSMPGRAKRGRLNKATGKWMPWRRGSTPTTRWENLAPALVESLNQLTGLQIYSPEEWFDLVQQNKRNTKALFTDLG